MKLRGAADVPDSSLLVHHYEWIFILTRHISHIISIKILIIAASMFSRNVTLIKRRSGGWICVQNIWLKETLAHIKLSDMLSVSNHSAPLQGTFCGYKMSAWRQPLKDKNKDETPVFMKFQVLAGWQPLRWLAVTASWILALFFLLFQSSAQSLSSIQISFNIEVAALKTKVHPRVVVKHREPTSNWIFAGFC